MGKINLLSSKVFNRIAAGEVVERPQSVVKELVENSLDAGANNIEISIENGGISSIIVRDNGVGILKEDLKLALMPHATSKISKVKDLDSISTLGFRGEALASISNVSQTNITTKTAKSEIAYYLEVNGGEFGEIQASSGETGTKIEVNNLFYKFLNISFISITEICFINLCSPFLI